MKLRINSKQNYKTHVEEYTEEFECSVEKNKDILKINFADGTIEIEDNKLVYLRGENKIIIEPDKINECDYETQYGTFVLDIKGLTVEKVIEDYEKIETSKEEMIIAKAKYEIIMVGVEPYTNEIEIIID